jgi:hypothetical protein
MIRKITESPTFKGDLLIVTDLPKSRATTAKTTFPRYAWVETSLELTPTVRFLWQKRQGI